MKCLTKCWEQKRNQTNQSVGMIEKDWEVGTAIKMRQLHHYLRVQVFDMLVLHLGMQIYRALDMLRYMIGKVKQASNEVGYDFDEYFLVSPKK
jgi:hypothetical protein